MCRVAKMKALMAAAGTEDPAELPPGEVDGEALAYIAKQVGLRAELAWS